MSRPKYHRLPFAPVTARTRGIDDTTLALRLGVTRWTIMRWRTEGVPLPAAERVAAELGTHVSALWPDPTERAPTVEPVDETIEEIDPQRWWEGAACRGLDPEMFFPARGDSRGLQEALAVCATCPVTEPCMEEGLVGERWGIWGATSERERRKIRRERGRRLR